MFMVGGFIALIAFLALVAFGVTAIPVALFLVLIIAMALTRALRLGGRAYRLPAVAAASTRLAPL